MMSVPIVLLTGASGFVGRHMSAAVPCVALADRDGVEVDLRNRGQVLTALAALRFDTVVHLAAQASVTASFDDPDVTYDVNFTGTHNLLRCLKELGFTGRLLYVGTAEEYGEVDETCLPVSEHQPLRPRSPYAVSKVAAEALCYQWSQTAGLDVVCVRPFNHVGPGQSASYVIPAMARQVVEIRRHMLPAELVLGSLDVTRDVLDVRDVVSAYVALLDGGRSGEVYNVCSGVERSVRELATALLEAGGVQATLSTDERLVRPYEQKRMVGDNTKLRKATGWSPSIPFVRTLADVIDDWEARLT
jgi:GDP-4-dehydro-6-deoxy-D-mannose reductase